MCKSFQYADETTFFSHAKVRNLSEAIDDMSRTLDRLYIARGIHDFHNGGPLGRSGNLLHQSEASKATISESPKRSCGKIFQVC